MQTYIIRLERIVRMLTDEMLAYLNKDYDKGCRIVFAKDVELGIVPRVRDIVDTDPDIMTFLVDKLVIPEMSADPDKKIVATNIIDLNGERTKSLRDMMYEIKTLHERAGWKITFMAESWKEILGIKTAATAAN